jgi:hypothetical protein
VTAIGEAMLALRNVRMRRLRMTVARRLQPLASRMALFEHATAVLDARLLTTVFETWKQWCGSVRDLRQRRHRKLLQRVTDAYVVPDAVHP